jgi:acetyl-CoA synthetase
MLGVVPSIVRSWRANGATDGVDWSSIKVFSSTGEASNPTEMHWLMSRANYRPVIEYCGGTEIGGGYITGSVLQPQAAATFSTPAIGTGIYLLDESGSPATSGEVALCAPMMGSSEHLLNADHHQIYFSGMAKGPNGETLRRHGDQINSLGGGYFRAMGRVDDTMNLGGIKVSSAELERACGAVKGIKELAAVAVQPADGGPSELVIAVVLTADTEHDTDSLRASFQQQIRSTLNPLFKVNRVVLMASLPRTASNKVMRRVIRGSLST